MVAGVRLFFVQRPDALMLGVFLAIVNAHLPEATTTRYRRWIAAIATMGLVVFLIALNGSNRVLEKLGLPFAEYFPASPEGFSRAQMMATPYWFRFGHTLGAIGFALVLFGLVRHREWWVARLLSLKPLQWYGQRSYTVYIWHALPFLLILGATGSSDDTPMSIQILRLPFLILAATLVSMLVYSKVELRVLGSSLMRHTGRSPLAAGKVEPGKDESVVDLRDVDCAPAGRSSD